MPAKPKLADVKCSRVPFKPGDCVLVRTSGGYSHEQLAKFKRAVEAWAGEGVRAIIIDTTKVSVEVVENKGLTEIIVTDARTSKDPTGLVL